MAFINAAAVADVDDGDFLALRIIDIDNPDITGSDPVTFSRLFH